VRSPEAEPFGGRLVGGATYEKLPDPLLVSAPAPFARELKVETFVGTLERVPQGSVPNVGGVPAPFATRARPDGAVPIVVPLAIMIELADPVQDNPNVPELMIGDPEIAIPVGTVIPTEVTVPELIP
jgi:hypothetical protein